MTKSKTIRLCQLVAVAALAVMTASYRAALARDGTPLIYGGFQYETGLLALLICLIAVGLFVMSVVFYKPQALRPGPVGAAYKVASFLAGIGMAASGVLLYMESSDGMSTMLYIQTVFLVLCGITLVLRTLRDGEGQISGLFSLFPVYYLCLLLLVFYRENSRNPVVLSFAFEILTILALTVAVYSVSGRGFNQYRGQQRLFFGLLAVFFVCFELASWLFYPDLVLTVPKLTPALLAQMAAMGLYVASELFLPPLPKPPEPEKAADDGDEPEAVGPAETPTEATLYLDVDIAAGDPAQFDAVDTPSDEALARERFPKEGKYFEDGSLFDADIQAKLTQEGSAENP